jgi:hypothetical protein
MKRQWAREGKKCRGHTSLACEQEATSRALPYGAIRTVISSYHLANNDIRLSDKRLMPSPAGGLSRVTPPAALVLYRDF